MGGAPLSAISGGYIQAGNTGNLMLTPSPDDFLCASEHPKN